MIKILFMLHSWLAALVLYLIVISIGIYLLDHKIIKFKYEWIQYPYYYGLGVLSYFPANYILKQNR